MKTTILAIALFSLAQGCSPSAKVKKAYLNSKNIDSLIRGTYLLNSRDTHYIKIIFENPYLVGITHWGDHYGKSIYVARMEMLQRISQLDPPVKVTDVPDSAIINFYRRWATKQGYLKE